MKFRPGPMLGAMGRSRTIFGNLRANDSTISRVRSVEQSSPITSSIGKLVLCARTFSIACPMNFSWLYVTIATLTLGDAGKGIVDAAVGMWSDRFRLFCHRCQRQPHRGGLGDRQTNDSANGSNRLAED